VLVACWSAKGGAGTTVVAVSLSLLLARRDAPGALLVDLDGDAPGALGTAEPDGPGLAGWLAAGPEVPADALARLEAHPATGLGLLARGTGALDASRAEVLVALLRQEPRTVVVDCGAGPDGVAAHVAAAADRSVLVTRPCFLALRKALAAPLRPTEVVLLEEPGRALRAADVEDVLGVPVVAEVAVDPAVARAVDAGLLAARLPRGLARELGRAA
jgi:MinD-like ATPase involved in chromosome partitioning or flagellar assembly